MIKQAVWQSGAVHSVRHILGDKDKTMKLAENVIRELKSIGANKYPLYEKILKHSFDINSPIFAKDKFSRAYRELANDGEWFANQMVANACLEGYGAQQY